MLKTSINIYHEIEKIILTLIFFIFPAIYRKVIETNKPVRDQTQAIRSCRREYTRAEKSPQMDHQNNERRLLLQRDHERHHIEFVCARSVH